MKTSFAVLLLLAVVLTSCSGAFRAEKRHYRNGFYITIGPKQEHVESKAAQTRSIDSADAARIEKRSAIPAESSSFQNAEIVDTLASSTIVAVQHVSADTGLPRKIDAYPVVISPSQPDSPASAPENIHTLNTLFRIALIMFGVALLLFGLSLLFPPAAMATLVLAGTAYGLGFISIALDVAILIVAGNLKQHYKDTDAGSAYAKIEKRALWFVAGLGIALAVFLIALVIAAVVALSNWH